MIESRTDKSLKNIKVSMLFYALNLILQFFSRKIFLEYLGSEVLGLNTTAQNLLGFLNLAELGISSAVAYCLYRPLYDGDKISINNIISLQGWLYRKIAFLVIFLSLILMLFFPLIFSKANIPLSYAYGAFIVFLVSSLLGYFINYKQILLTADQKEYKITFCLQSVRLFKVLLQIMVLFFLSKPYVSWLSLELIMAFAASYWLSREIKKEYPWLNTSVKNGKLLSSQYPIVIKKTKQIFFHRIGGFVLQQTSPLIIYAFTSLTIVAIYGNYILIISGVTMLTNALFNGISAGVGNLVAEGDKAKIKNVFWELNVAQNWIASIVCFLMFFFGSAFIRLWVGSEYELPDLAFLVLTLITYINLTRTSDLFVNAYGIFQDVYAPVIEAILNVGLSILLGFYYGITGIFFGVLVSLVLMILGWKPYFLFTRGFKLHFSMYVYRYLKILVFITISCVISNYILSKLVDVKSILSYEMFILYFLLAFVIYAIISIILLLAFEKSTKSFIQKLYNQLIIKIVKR